MQLLILNVNDREEFMRAVRGLKQHGFNGIVFPTTSLKHALLDEDVEPAPIFGSISKLVDNDLIKGDTLLMTLDEEHVELAKAAIRSVKLKHKGIMYTMPLSSWEEI